MKKLFYFFILIYTSSCGSIEVASLGDYIDDYHKLIGFEIAELKEIFSDSSVEFSPISTHEPEESMPAFLVSFKDKSFFSIGGDKIDALLFREKNFKFRKGAKIGQGFCEIIKLYSEARFYFDFSEGTLLQLHIENGRVILNFDTSNLPLGQYISQGYPSKDDSTLCSSHLIYIKLSN